MKNVKINTIMRISVMEFMADTSRKSFSIVTQQMTNLTLISSTSATKQVPGLESSIPNRLPFVTTS